MPALNAEPDMPISAARVKVAKAYCKAFAAIDDEVCERGDQRRLTERFELLRQSCEDAGILCHLFPYPMTVRPPEDPEISPVVQRAVKIARAADVIVLDWNLGMEDSAAHALQVVQALADTTQVRFVMIYTQNPNLESIVEELQNRFPQLAALDPPPPPPSPDEDAVLDSEQAEAEAAEGRKLNYHLNNKLFVFIRKKEDLRPDRIVEEARTALLKAFPDHLRWAGLEMAVRARELLPRVVATLPNDTDSPLLLQHLYQREEEVAGQVADVLLDELRFAIRDEPLEVVADKELFSALSRRMSVLTADRTLFTNTAKRLNADVAAKLESAERKANENKQPSRDEQDALNLTSRWAAMTPSDLNDLRDAREKSEKKLSKYFPYKHDDRGDGCRAIVTYLNNGDDAEGAISQYVSWATVRESVLLLGQQSRPQPGTVMKRQSGSNTAPEWLLCVTPACDCYRPTGKGFLFVAGAAKPLGDKTTATGVGKTQTCVAQTEVVWDSTHLVIVEVPNSDDLQRDDAIQDSGMRAGFECHAEGAAYTIAGILRYEFAVRLLQRVWVHQARLGVDTSEFIRLRRAE